MTCDFVSFSNSATNHKLGMVADLVEAMEGRRTRRKNPPSYVVALGGQRIS